MDTENDAEVRKEIRKSWGSNRGPSVLNHLLGRDGKG